MNPYVLYALGGALGVLVPIRSVTWASLVVIGVIFDNLRYENLSLTNVLLAAFLMRCAAQTVTARSIRNSAVLLPIALWVAVATVANYFGNRTSEGRSALISFCSLAAMACALAQVGGDCDRLTTLVKACLWMSGLTSASVVIEWGLYTFFGIQWKDNIYGYANLGVYLLQGSGFFDTNAIACMHILPGLILACFLIGELGSRRQRWFMSFYILLSVAAMICTLARAGLISLLALSLLLFLRRARRSGSASAKLLALGGLAGLFLITPVFLGFLAQFNERSYLARYAIINGAVEHIMEHPLLGTGPGSGVAAAYSWRGTWSDETAGLGSQADESTRDTHNTFLQIAVDMGLLGFLCFTALMSRLTWRVLRLLKGDCGIKRVKPMVEALLYALGLTLFCSAFDSVLYLKPIWLMLGLTAGALLAAKFPSGRLVRPEPRLTSVPA